MSAATDMQRAKEAMFDTRRQIFGRDLCDIIAPSFTEGGAGGDSVALNPIATNIEVFIEEISGAVAQTVLGGESFISSHRLNMKRSAVTLAITPEHRIKVYPRDGMPERIFEKPVDTAKSFNPILMFKASLVKQGYQQ